MIVGTGIDICPIHRIEKSLHRFGERFKKRICTPWEIERCDRNPARMPARYAQMFAAKESCAKALGTGIKYGVAWRDMEMRWYGTGQPYMVVYGGAEKRLQQLTPDGYRPHIDLTITDDAGLVQAMVVISVVPQDTPERATGQMPDYMDKPL